MAQWCSGNRVGRMQAGYQAWLGGAAGMVYGTERYDTVMCVAVLYFAAEDAERNGRDIAMGVQM